MFEVLLRTKNQGLSSQVGIGIVEGEVGPRDPNEEVEVEGMGREDEVSFGVTIRGPERKRKEKWMLKLELINLDKTKGKRISYRS